MTRLNESNYPQEVYRTKQTKLPERLNLGETSVKVIETHVKKTQNTARSPFIGSWGGISTECPLVTLIYLSKVDSN